MRAKYLDNNPNFLIKQDKLPTIISPISDPANDYCNTEQLDTASQEPENLKL